MEPTFSNNYQFLARYNHWFNQRLYAACDGLSGAVRQQDNGAFFGSIHRTLNHLLVADQVWLRRFVDCGIAHGAAWPVLTDAIRMPAQHPLNQPLHADWTALRAHREALDTAIETWLADAPADMPGWTMVYANSKGTQRQHPMWQALTHFFNHQTHHRGQVTTLLSQQGVDVGVTDLIALV
ncbi:DinB family protein [Rhodoferax sp.]|uniref:DinB family protein n=1 Tax=Rhodoferax sp. TaxID=50421 RepID=UPI002600373A|nr:DinB family protein [Rhodoferax sp.]